MWTMKKKKIAEKKETKRLMVWIFNKYDSFIYRVIMTIRKGTYHVTTEEFMKSK